jgi:hypothetical protein
MDYYEGVSDGFESRPFSLSEGLGNVLPCLKICKKGHLDLRTTKAREKRL